MPAKIIPFPRRRQGLVHLFPAQTDGTWCLLPAGPTLLAILGPMPWSPFGLPFK